MTTVRILLLLIVLALSGCATPYQPRYRQLGDWTRDWDRYDEFKLRQQFKQDALNRLPTRSPKR